MRRDRADDEAAPGARPAPHRGELTCAASGCVWQGGAGALGGPYYCIAHWGRDASEESAISVQTQALNWWAVFIADVQRMVYRPRKGESSWVEYATTYWANSDPAMVPSERERKSPALYLYRMFGELRASALGLERPEPHRPQADNPIFHGAPA